jgi:ATP/maltotriose-dependent transcriptional regulator MalT
MSKLLKKVLPSHLHWLFTKQKGQDKRVYPANTSLASLDVVPTDPAVRQRWFSLSFREREIAALIYMGYKNPEIANALAIGYGTVQTHLQNIFLKFGVRRRGEVRKALESWRADEWWDYHHR